MSNNNQGTVDCRFGMFCIWTCEGETQEVYATSSQGPYTESVNPDTQGWLDVAVLFNTESEANSFNETWDLEGVVYNVGDFLREHDC